MTFDEICLKAFICIWMLIKWTITNSQILYYSIEKRGPQNILYLKRIYATNKYNLLVFNYKLSIIKCLRRAWKYIQLDKNPFITESDIQINMFLMRLKVAGKVGNKKVWSLWLILVLKKSFKSTSLDIPLMEMLIIYGDVIHMKKMSKFFCTIKFCIN